MKTKADNPTNRVKRPYMIISHNLKHLEAQNHTSMRNIHRHPDLPLTPLMWKIPKPRKPARISAMLIAVQKNERRMASS
jgi:hypothetical protein